MFVSINGWMNGSQGDPTYLSPPKVLWSCGEMLFTTYIFVIFCPNNEFNIQNYCKFCKGNLGRGQVKPCERWVVSQRTWEVGTASYLNQHLWAQIKSCWAKCIFLNKWPASVIYFKMGTGSHSVQLWQEAKSRSRVLRIKVFLWSMWLEVRMGLRFPSR